MLRTRQGRGFLNHAQINHPQFPALGLRHDSSSRSYIAKTSDDALTICWYSSNQTASLESSGCGSRSIALSISATVLMRRDYHLRLQQASRSRETFPLLGHGLH